MPQRFPRVANASDFGLTADKVCQPAQWTAIGTLTVPAQQAITFGIGAVAGGVDTREVCYIRVDATTGQLAGKIRAYLADANLTNKRLVFEQRTERLSASQYSKTDGFLVGEFLTKAKEDSKLVIEFYPDSATAVTIDFDDADSILLVPITVYQ